MRIILKWQSQAPIYSCLCCVLCRPCKSNSSICIATRQFNTKGVWCGEYIILKQSLFSVDWRQTTVSGARTRYQQSGEKKNGCCWREGRCPCQSAGWTDDICTHQVRRGVNCHTQRTLRHMVPLPVTSPPPPPPFTEKFHCPWPIWHRFNSFTCDTEILTTGTLSVMSCVETRHMAYLFL